MEDSRCLKETCEAADKRDKCHQLPRVQIKVAGQGKDGLDTGCLYSQQNWLVHKPEGTHKSDEPVSKTILNFWGGVPMVMLPTYTNYREKEGVGYYRSGYGLFPHSCLPLNVIYLLRSRSNNCVAHWRWSQRCLHLKYFSCATWCARYWLYGQALKWYFMHWKHRGKSIGPPGQLDTQGSPGTFIWEAL